MSNEIVAYQEKIGALSPLDVRSQVNLIQHILREVMKKDEHYGVIPGTGTKPTLLKAGAEKLCLTFRLDPQYDITEKQEGQHVTITSKCTLWHIPSGQRYGSGMGMCSTRESKYAYRQAAIKCPECGKETVIKGKEEYGGGWVCFKKKGGCGAKFPDGNQAIESQPRGRVPNDDLADTYNTVLKMANKRSLVAAVLNATAASDIFTQDIEDMAPAAPVVERDELDEALRKKEMESFSAPQASPPPPTPSPAEAAFISVDQAIALEDALKANNKSKEKLLANVSRQYGVKIERLAQIRAEDWEAAMAYASPQSDAA